MVGSVVRVKRGGKNEGGETNDTNDPVTNTTPTEIDGLRAQVVTWRGRAERMRGLWEASRGECGRLREDNTRLARALADLAAQIALRPAQAAPSAPQAPDLASALVPILAEFRRAVSPDIHISGKSDASDEQRRGINWSDQGLDNTGGTPEGTRGPFDDEPISIPDYVLDVENLTADQVKGTRGGWYNPQKSA